VLPEIRLDWWDTMANRQRTAVLPEHRVRVAPLDLVPESAVSLPEAMAGTGLPAGTSFGAGDAVVGFTPSPAAALQLNTPVTDRLLQSIAHGIFQLAPNHLSLRFRRSTEFRDTH